MARYNFQTDGDFVDFTDNGNLVVRLHNSSRCIKWRYDDTPGISFAIDLFEIQTDDVANISFDGTPLTEQSGFETAITAMFPGLAGGGEGGIDDVLSQNQSLADNRTIQLGGNDLYFLNGTEEFLVIGPSSFAAGFFPDDGTAHSEIIANANSAGAVNFVLFSDNGIGDFIQIVGNGVTKEIEYDALTHRINGSVLMTSLPTADPAVEGALWNDGGTIKISAG